MARIGITVSINSSKYKNKKCKLLLDKKMAEKRKASSPLDDHRTKSDVIKGKKGMRAETYDRVKQKLSYEMSINEKSYEDHEFTNEFSGLRDALWDYVYTVNNLSHVEFNTNLDVITKMWNNVYSYIPILFNILRSYRKQFPTYEKFRALFSHSIMREYSVEMIKDFEKERAHLEEISNRVRSVQKFITIHRGLDNVGLKHLGYIEEYLTTYKAAVEYVKSDIVERHEPWYVNMILQEPLYDPEDSDSDSD